MTLFFSRRALNAQKNKFTNNPSTVTRYVSISGQSPGGKWSAHLMSQPDWVKAVKAKAGASKEVLVFVHGFNTEQKDMLRRHAKIEGGLRANGFKGAIIAYDWPSDGSLFKYASDRADAKKTAPYLVKDGLVPLMAGTSGLKVHLLAHSMGGYLTLRALSGAGDAAIPGGGAWNLDQVAYASGDCDEDWFEKGAWGGLVLNRRAERFTNYYNPLDEVLSLSGTIINGHSRAGRVGLPVPVHNRQFDIYCKKQYLRDVPGPKRTVAYSHSWWFDNAGFYKDFAETLAGVAANQVSTRKPTNTTDLALLS